MSFWNRGEGHAKREAATAQRYYAEARADAAKAREEYEAQRANEQKSLEERQVRSMRQRKRRSGLIEDNSGPMDTLG